MGGLASLPLFEELQSCQTNMHLASQESHILFIYLHGFRVLFELLEARACNLTLQSMDKDARVEETVDLLTNAELVRSVSDKHHDLLRPSARNYTRGQAKDGSGHGKGKHALLRDTEDFQMGIYDKPLPFFGCGVGWFSFLFGFLCPPMWFYATILYFGNHYRKDPRERAGLGASAIAALLCSVALLIIAVIHLLKLRSHYF